MKTYRTDIHTKKFPNNYYQFLAKQMMNPHANTALDIIDRFYTESHHGLAFEALWTILISLGFCKKFNRQEYDFYEATLKEPTRATSPYFITKIMTNDEYLQFLQHTPIKGVNGKSDITLRRKSDGRWVFISCKYYKKEGGDYDIPAIHASIQKTNEKYPHLIGNNYEIYAFVNNKQKAHTTLQGSNMAKTDVNKHIQTEGAYNVLGMDDLETCFRVFKDTITNMPWDYFKRMHLRRYSQLPTLNMTLGQMPIVNTTYKIILENRKRCIPPQQHLKIYWKTMPQFGKTYCVGMLFLKLVRLFNAVVVVNHMDILHKYSRELLGGHRQFVDNFNVMEIPNKILAEKAYKKLLQSTDKNNILVILKEHLDAVYTIPNLQLIVFDEYDDQSNTQFENFAQSPTRIGLFLTSSVDVRIRQHRQQKTMPACDHMLTWTFDDQSRLQQIIQKIAPSQQGQAHIQSLLQQHPHKQSLRVALSRRDTTQDIHRCLENSLDLYIVSHYINPAYKRFGDIFKLFTTSSMTTRTTSRAGPKTSFMSDKKVISLLQDIEKISRQKAGGGDTFTTQLWFLPHKNHTNISEVLRNMMKDIYYFTSFDIIMLNEPDKKENPNRHPGPLKDKLTQLISHYQTRA